MLTALFLGSPAPPPPNSGGRHPINPPTPIGFLLEDLDCCSGGTSRVECAECSLLWGGPMQLCFVCFHLVSFRSYLCKMQVLFLREFDLLGSAA